MAVLVVVLYIPVAGALQCVKKTLKKTVFLVQCLLELLASIHVHVQLIMLVGYCGGKF